MKTDLHESYNSIWPIIKRHLSSTLPFLNVRKVVNIAISRIELVFNRKKLISKPFFIKIEPTNRCNLRCKGCLHSADRSELTESHNLGDMEFGLFKNIIDELKLYLVKVSLYSMGESLIYKNILEMIAYLTSHKIGSVISSNLNYLPDELAEGLVKNKLAHLIVSLDGSCDETYSKYREGGSFSKVVENIKKIQQMKRRLGSKYPIIEIQTIGLEHISGKEKNDIREIAETLGVEKFTIKQNVTPHYESPDPVQKTCFWLYGNPQIQFDGTVQPCCHYYEYGNNRFGDASRFSLSDIWNNEKFMSARKFFDDGKPGKTDIKCHTCIFFAPNKITRVPTDYFAEWISFLNRKRKWKEFSNAFTVSENTSVLDVGYTDNEYKDTDNYLEKNYPFQEKITALGIDDPKQFQKRYPSVKAIKYDGVLFPFEDKEFDICFSSATVEHVGGREKQLLFLKEITRVGKRAFITTPNRWFPVEVHTRLPLLHFLPKNRFDALLKKIGLDWATDDYMHLLSERKIKSLLKEAGIKRYRIIKNKVLFFTMDYTIII